MNSERALNLIVTASAAILVAVIAATGIASALSSGGNASPAPPGPPRATYTVHRMGGQSQQGDDEFVVTISDSG